MLRIIINNKKTKEIPDQRDSNCEITSDTQTDRNEK